MDRDEIVDSRTSWSDVFLMKESKMAFFKKDAKIGIRRHGDRMHLQFPSLLSNDWGEVQPQVMKRAAIIVLKIIIAAGLLWYLKISGRLNPVIFSKVEFSIFFLTFPFYFLSFFVGILRWRILIKACGLPLSLWDATRLGMSGNWISSIIPGGSLFSGDIARTAIFALENQNMRVIGLTSVLLDRVLGLLAVFIISLVSLLINFRLFNTNGWLIFVGVILAFSVIVTIVMLVFLLSKKSHEFLNSSQFLKRIPGYQILLKIINSFYIFRNHLPSLLKAHLVSYLGHGAMIFAIINLARYIGISLQNQFEYLFAISLGIITATLPISGPVGVGAGNVGFAISFAFLNSGSGADLALFWQLTFILASQSGLVFFMLNRKRRSNKITILCNSN